MSKQTVAEKETTVEEKLKSLFSLQQIDSSIDKIKIIRGELPLEVADLEDEVTGLETRIAKLTDEVKNLEEAHADRKNSIKDAQEAIKKYTSQQDKVRNNREFDSLTKEIEYQNLDIQLSEKKMKELGAEPIARLVSYGVAGVPPRIMGIGPIEAIPKALKQAGLKQNDMDLIELNEAFASQSLAIIRTLGLDQSKINVNGGAIALGHPLGCTGAKLSVQLFNELKRQDKKYGMVTMCVGTGQGAAGIFEVF
jgi:predicted RNase H-like nuclease (RuvC/YqgF family)